MGIVEDLEEPVSHFGWLLSESGMDAGNDDVHLGKDSVGEIERAVGKYVDFNTGEDLDAFDLFVGFANARDMGFGAFVVEPVGKGEILGMVGDSHVLVATLARGRSHFFDCALAVGLDGVSMNVSEDVGLRK